jgi:hypothetical protein
MGGFIPSEVYGLRLLETIDLQNANFEGELSEEFGRLNLTIKEILLDNNNFFGSIPRALDDCRLLRK